MNKRGIEFLFNYKDNVSVNSLSEADVIYSPSEYLDTKIFPEKIFLFGPHFSIFPNDDARKIDGKFRNSAYLQPSQPSVDTWVKEFNFNNIPVFSFPFPVEIPEEKTNKKDKIILYYKERKKEDLEFVEKKLRELNIDYHLISYGSYQEDHYQSLVDRAKYIIWVGRHESQGFALESALSKNIPIFVWTVTKRTQQINCPAEFHSSGFTPVTTIPYWDLSCGEYFKDKNEFDEKFSKFLNNLENYNPRDFVSRTLSIEPSYAKFHEILRQIKENMKNVT